MSLPACLLEKGETNERLVRLNWCRALPNPSHLEPGWPWALMQHTFDRSSHVVWARPIVIGSSDQ